MKNKISDSCRWSELAPDGHLEKTVGTYLYLLVVAAVFLVTNLSVDPLVYYHYCWEPKYSPGTRQPKYFSASCSESNVNSLLNLFVKSAAFYTYNNFTVNGLYGLYQCSGGDDISSGDCLSCVDQAVRRLQSHSVGACNCALQLESCLVKYDNVMFFGLPDKTAMLTYCGGRSYNLDESTLINELVSSLVVGSSGSSYRTGTSGEAQAVAQCTKDLNESDCQDCLTEAMQRLKRMPICSTGTWGDVYLAKCYLGYSSRGATGQEMKKSVAAKPKQPVIPRLDITRAAD
ncbi:unnamed protein product [Microthlaspi erraticum]|uniref:Gnk2-homologous domain-containing protein n=1 Tax=Microthlaspi erraticum TaxID=1685480 RepID=A0A6D2I4D6_9BRAS|nr:unnamed protein product [Microthlaspi erraticum]